jgi:hypothetical protein
MRDPAGGLLLQAADDLTTRVGVGLLCLLHCAKVREIASRGNFLLQCGLTTKLTPGPCGVTFYWRFKCFASGCRRLYDYAGAAFFEGATFAQGHR